LNEVLNPFGYSLAPCIDQSKYEYNNKEENFKKAKQAELLENHGPGNDKDDVYIKGHEEQCEDIETEWILHPG
jgi:hypothetical protein